MDTARKEQVHVRAPCLLSNEHYPDVNSTVRT